MLLMEDPEKWSVSTFSSLRGGIVALGAEYGRRSHHLNAAMAMFLLSEPDEQDYWLGLIEKARRMRDQRSMLERLRGLVEPISSSDEEARRQQAAADADEFRAGPGRGGPRKSRRRGVLKDHGLQPHIPKG